MGALVAVIKLVGLILLVAFIPGMWEVFTGWYHACPPLWWVAGGLLALLLLLILTGHHTPPSPSEDNPKHKSFRLTLW